MSDTKKYKKDEAIPNGWWIDPIVGAILYLADEAIFGGITKKAVGALSLAGDFLPLAVTHPAMQVNEESRMAFLRLAKIYKDNSELVKKMELEKDGFDRLNRHSLVTIWNVFESSLEDLLFGLLLNENESFWLLSPLEINGLKPQDFPVIDMVSAVAVGQKIRRKLLQENNFIRCFEIIFSCYGAKIESTKYEIEKLLEAKEIRNCIVHRKGYVDSRVTKKISSLKKWEGKNVVITEEAYLEYHKAIGDYLGKVYNAFLRTSYAYKKPKEA